MKTKITHGENAKVTLSRDSKRDPEFDVVVLQTLPNVTDASKYDSISFNWETFTTVRNA